MRYKIKVIRLLTAAGVVVFFSLLLFTQLWGNLYGMIQDPGYRIPRHSSLLSFKVTVMNPGSGDWWLYGEDGKYHYAYSDSPAIKCHVFPKELVDRCPSFVATDKATWCVELMIDEKP